MKIDSILLNVFSLVIIFSCSHQAPKQGIDVSFNPATKPFALLDTTLTHEQINEDIDYLIRVLNRAYSGSVKLPDEEFKNLVKKLKGIKGPKTIEQFGVLVSKLFMEISDSHLTVYFKGLNNQGINFKASVDQDLIGSNMAREGVWKVESTLINKRKVVIVGITQFPNPSSQLWNGFEEKIMSTLEQNNVLIIDLRGNKGGDDSKGYWLASYLRGKEAEVPYATPFDMNTPEAFVVMANAPIVIKSYFNGLSLEDADLEWIKKLKFLEAKALRGEKVDLRNNAAMSSTRGETRSKFRHRGPIYLLIDNKCSSSGESSVDFFENIPRVTKVGQNTAGMVHFGNNGFVMLANSSLVIQLATSFNSYKDGRFIEKTGIKPDIYIESGKNALNEVFKMIEL